MWKYSSGTEQLNRVCTAYALVRKCLSATLTSLVAAAEIYLGQEWPGIGFKWPINVIYNARGILARINCGQLYDNGGFIIGNSSK